MTTRIPVNDDLQSASERARHEAAATRNGASRESLRAGRQRVPLTDRQRDFIFSLSAERSAAWTGSAEQVATVEGMSKSEASEMIGRLLKLPKIVKAAEPIDGPTDAPAGRYALDLGGGEVAFYKVDRPTEGRWKGYVFVKGLVGAPGSWNELKLGRAGSDRVLRLISKDWKAAAELYGLKFTRCSFCESPLSDLRSRAALYGEVCAGNHGLHYPTKDEARAILLARGETV